MRLWFALWHDGGRRSRCGSTDAQYGHRRRHGIYLTVNGSNFASGAVVYWNGTTRTTTMTVAGTQLTAMIAAADIATAGTIPVYVRNPGGTGIYMNQGGQNSNMMNFMVK